MDLLTMGETLAITGLERKTLYRLRQRGEFPAHVVLSTASHNVFFRSDQVNAWCVAHGLSRKTRRVHRDP